MNHPNQQGLRQLLIKYYQKEISYNKIYHMLFGKLFLRVFSELIKH